MQSIASSKIYLILAVHPRCCLTSCTYRRSIIRCRHSPWVPFLPLQTLHSRRLVVYMRYLMSPISLHRPFYSNRRTNTHQSSSSPARDPAVCCSRYFWHSTTSRRWCWKPTRGSTRGCGRRNTGCQRRASSAKRGCWMTSGQRPSRRSRPSAGGASPTARSSSRSTWPASATTPTA